MYTLFTQLQHKDFLNLLSFKTRGYFTFMSKEKCVQTNMMQWFLRSYKYGMSWTHIPRISYGYENTLFTFIIIPTLNFSSSIYLDQFPCFLGKFYTCALSHMSSYLCQRDFFLYREIMSLATKFPDKPCFTDDI